MIEATDENSRSTGPREHQFLDVSVDVKNHVAQFLLQNLNAAGTVIKGAQKEAANRWKMSVPTVKRIWKEAKRQAVQQRTTIRKMAKSLDMSKSTLHRFIQAKQLRAHSKVMFLCAVARPQFSASGVTEFDGKIGIFPFTTQLPAMRKSKNRPKGTLETKPIQNVTKTVIKDCLINQVIPAIKQKWPLNFSKDIIIQQDNAKPHLQIEDQEFTDAANSDGFHIRLVCQPSNSPDVNVNDLGWFRAIQGLQDDKHSNNVDSLLENVINAFEELSAETLNKVFLTLQSCLVEIMKDKGGNNYKIPHMNKRRLERIGELPTSLAVDEGLVKDTLEYLKQKDIEMGSLYDFQAIRMAFGF